MASLMPQVTELSDMILMHHRKIGKIHLLQIDLLFISLQGFLREGTNLSPLLLP
jgi:hypothetical protein